MNQSTSKKEESSKEKESDAIHSISDIMQTGLNKRTIAVLTELIELGIEPESLVDGKSRR
jgi:Mitotic-spindle organizing gamma-tubulin ring associated